MFAHSLYLFGLAALIVTQLSGCKAGGAIPAGYVPEQQSMAKDSTLPFHSVWYEQNFDWASRDKLIVRPINTQYVRKNNWWKAAGRDKVEMKEDLRGVAQRFRAEIIKAFSTRDGNRFTVTQSAGPNTLVLELAIVDLVPTDKWINVVTYLPLQMSFSKGLISIEGRIRDAESAELVGAFADSEKGKESLLSKRDFSWYAHIDAVMEDWAKQLVVVLNSDEGEHIKDSPGFTMNPF